MYTLIKRTVTPPAPTIFDASTRDICEVKRSRTNTPLQALVMLNDPTVLEASRVLASQLLESPDATSKARISQAFRRIVCRKPSDTELDLLLGYYEQERKKITPQKAKLSLQVGEYPLPSKANAVEVAALMRVIMTLYNLEETITKT
jgi:hypothetical protein